MLTSPAARPPAGTSDVIAVVDDLVMTGFGETNFDAAPDQGRRRGLRRQLDLPRVPDLPPPPGAPASTRSATSSAPTASRSTRSAPKIIGPGSRWRRVGSIAERPLRREDDPGRGLMDEAAYPWQADWYRRPGAGGAGRRARRPVPRLVRRPRHAHWPTVRSSRATTARCARRGSSATAACSSRRCATSPPGSSTGVPPHSDRYEMVDGQVLVPAPAAERKGVQPGGRPHRQRRAGPGRRGGRRAPSSFTADVEVPPGTGTIVVGRVGLRRGRRLPADGRDARRLVGPARPLGVAHLHRAGHLLPGVRVASQRRRALGEPHGRILNLARVRVVVS